ncbi:MAG: hypothetical protein QXE90_03750 [Candidatus Micrarchaeia archaeon]
MAETKFEDGLCGNKLKLHNEYIKKMIEQTKEYHIFSKIKVLYEDLIKKSSDIKRAEVYKKQYKTASLIFLHRISEYNKNWKKIEEE